MHSFKHQKQLIPPLDPSTYYSTQLVELQQQVTVGRLLIHRYLIQPVSFLLNVHVLMIVTSVAFLSHCF